MERFSRAEEKVKLIVFESRTKFSAIEPTFGRGKFPVNKPYNQNIIVELFVSLDQ